MTKQNNNDQRSRTKPPASGNVLDAGGFAAADKLLPPALILCVGVFILYPVLRLVQTGFLSGGEYSFANYLGLLDKLYLLRNSVLSSALSAALSTALALAVALRVASLGPRLKLFFTSVLLLTMVSPPFVGALSYIQLYGRRGWITHGLLGLSVIPYNWLGVVLMQTLSHSSLSALFLTGMLDKADKSLLQAARDLGASPARSLSGVLLPLIQPGVWACLLLSFIRGLSDFGTPIVIGGRFSTVASEIYMQITGYANLSGAAALNTLIFAPSLALFFVYRKFIRRSDSMLGAAAVYGADVKLPLGGAVLMLTNAASALFFTALLLQYFCVFAGGFVKAVRGEYSFTLEYLRHLLTYDLSSMTRSVSYALVVGAAGTLFAMLLSYYIERRKIMGGDMWDFIATAPITIPGTCFGIGYILAFNAPPLKLTGTAAIVIVNMMFRQLPSTVKICGASMSQIPYALEDAARDLGAGKLRVLRDVILPNLKPAFFTGFAYNFSNAMTTAGAVLFLIQPSRKIAVFRLFDAVNTGDYGVASLLAGFIMLVSVTVNMVLYRLGRDKKQGGARVVFTAGQSV